MTTSIIRRPRSNAGIHALRLALTLGGAAFLTLPCGHAAAQTAGTAGIETVVVTAERREENILNVGINITSLSADDLRTSRVNSATDLATQIPNVDVKTNIPGAQQIITVRGVGLDDFSSTNNSSVGVYVDDVFLASFAEMDFNMYDLARVEVLKGPQGTLYGRNSTAGAINLISARPSTDGAEANVSAGYGNFGAFEAEGMLNMPLDDTLAVRFAAKVVNQSDGYWFSRVLDRDLGRQNILLGRMQALWKPTSGLTVLLKVEGEHNRSEIGVGKFFGTISTVPGESCPDFADPSHCVDAHGYTDTTTNKFEGDWNHLAPYNVDQWNGTLHIDDDFGWATLTAITGYINFKREFYIDADAAPTSDVEFDQNDAVSQFSQEIRLAGDSSGISWLAGAYYSWDRVHSYTPGTLLDSFGLDAFIESRQITDSAAIFGQAKWPLTDQLTLTTGLRLTYEDRSYIGGTDFVVPVVGVHIPVTHEDDKIFNRNVSWHGGLDYKPDEDTLVYLSIARATKSGGFFNGISTQSEALAPYKPETLTDYEAGVKAQLLDRMLQIDGSVFYYDYSDLQAQTFTNVGAVSLIKLSNIDKATIYGLDLGATWLPVSGLTLRAGLGLLHTRLGSFPFATSMGVITMPAGNKLPDAPDVTFTGLARYEHPVSEDYLGSIQIEAKYADSSFKEALNTPYLFTSPNWVFDGRVALSTINADWELAFWVKNMFDEEHVVTATDDGLGMGYRIFNAPRTLGFTLSHKFG
ncbi:MAG TPA: TonB-dependent receptor [Rhizomicrobium sp.]|nr:TonB-dependent receptor [Rhizomicrobium sp.]